MSLIDGNIRNLMNKLAISPIDFKVRGANFVTTLRVHVSFRIILKLILLMV
jgi:hypothetical protein